MEQKRVLLIAGGGTLGTYTAEELLRMGYFVDIICLEDKVSDNKKLRYFKANVDIEYLAEFLKENYYDGIVNFMHYPTVEEYIPYHELLSPNTGHLIFISSYRVYGDMEHPITEDAPMLLDIIEDQEFLNEEKYALSKARCEKFLKQSSFERNWTIARPVISFSKNRMDMIMYYKNVVVDAFKTGERVVVPLEAKNLTAGIDWAGNSGKLIANLLFKKECFGEAYTVSSAQNLTWGEIADIYTRVLGVHFEWKPHNYPYNDWRWHYDRAYDRKIDNSKILAATGLKEEDFKEIEEGICIELRKLGVIE